MHDRSKGQLTMESTSSLSDSTEPTPISPSVGPTTPYSSASTPPPAGSHIAGYLLKKSTEGSWQRRYFETSGHFLTYYKSSKMTKLLAALALPQVGEILYVGQVEDNKGSGAIFQLDLKDRQYVLRADDEDTAKRWVDVLVVLRDSEIQTPQPSPMKSQVTEYSESGRTLNNAADVRQSAVTQGVGGGKPIPTPGEEARFLKKSWDQEIPDGCCVVS